MAIQTGDKLPEAKFRVMTAEGPQVKTTDDIFKGKKVALFAVPGAYTGTCHKMHLPSIFLNAYAMTMAGTSHPRASRRALIVSTPFADPRRL